MLEAEQYLEKFIELDAEDLERIKLERITFLDTFEIEECDRLETSIKIRKEKNVDLPEEYPNSVWTIE